MLRTVEKQAFSGSTPDEYCSRACKAVVILLFCLMDYEFNSKRFDATNTNNHSENIKER